MKIYKLILLLSIIFLGFFQSNSQEVNNYIIPANSTLKIESITIKNNYRFTNEDFVTYITGTNEEVTLSASEMKEYYNGDRIFKTFTDNEGNKKILSYDSYAYLTLAEGYDKKGNFKMYVIKDDIAVNIDKEKNRLNDFFNGYLKNDSSFVRSYKKINYDCQSVTEFISDYNVHYQPEKYVPVVYPPKKYLKLFFSLGSFAGSANFKTLDIKYNMMYSFFSGIDIQNNYNRFFSFYTSILYEKSLYNYNVGINNSYLNLNSINLELIPSFTLYQRGNMFLRIGPGIGLKYFFSSYIDTYRNSYGTFNDIEITPVMLAYSANLYFNLNEKLAFKVSYRDYDIKVNEFNKVGNSLSKETANCNSFSLNIQYTIRKKNLDKL